MKKKILKSTPFGSVGVIWSEVGQTPKIARVVLSRPGLSAADQAAALYPEARSGSCAKIDDVARAIQAFLEGENRVFALEAVDLAHCSSFQQAVLRAEHGIPWGKVSTYRLLAAHVGTPGGARAVGNALANNPFPLIVPCHRAIRSDRHLGGFQGGLEMKRALLEREGAVFDSAGRLISRGFHYQQA